MDAASERCPSTASLRLSAGCERPAEWAVFSSTPRPPIRIRDSPLTLDNISVRVLTALGNPTRDIRGSPVRHSPCCDANESLSLRVGSFFSSRTGAAVMRSYEFAYFGRDLRAPTDTLATWCSPRQCILETTALLEGARLPISGPDDMVREAMRMGRLWMHRTT